MKTHSSTYLIVGGGLAADAAIRSICKRDENAEISLLSAESSLPYERPSLSKDLLSDPDTTPESLMKDPEIYQKNVRTFLGRKAVRLEPDNHCVMDNIGEVHRYQKLLLATGGRPRKLEKDNPDIHYCRTLSDFKNLESDLKKGSRVAVIGDGYIGSEVAASLSGHDCDVFMIFPHPHLGSDRFPDSLSQHLDELYRSHQVDLLPGQQVQKIENSGDHLVAVTDGGGRYACDVAVAGIGMIPNTEIAREAGLKVEDGILVNEKLKTSHPDIYAAGDNASVYRKETDSYERVEHEMNALKMGEAAGRAMTGDPHVNFDNTPLFYSDIFDESFEAVGDLDTRLDIVEDWQKGLDQGVIYYLDGKQVRGVLLWNLFDKTKEARDLMQQEEITRPDKLRGCITA